MNEFFEAFGTPKRFCDVTTEVVDEEGLPRFYRCTREPGHSGAWHVGAQFGPNYKPVVGAPYTEQMWPVGNQPQPAQDDR